MTNVRLVPQSLAKAGLALLLVLLFAQAFAQTTGQTTVVDPLRYSKGFLVTGNYVVGGVESDGTAASDPKRLLDR